MKRLETKTSDGIFAITLNRPEKRNAIDMLMVDELSESLEHADLSADVRAVAIRGNGKDFCAGADLRELLESVDLPSEDNTRNAMRLGNIFLKIRELAKPVVAVVHGRALAGGCGLATACDIVLAHSDAQFGYTEIRRGFVPAMVMVMLRRAVGEKVAFELVSTGRLVSAEEALGMGLISKVVPAETFEADVNAVLGSLAASSGSALALIKRQLYELEGRSFREGVELGAEVNALARNTDEFRVAVKNFMES